MSKNILYNSSIYQHNPNNSYGCFITQQIEKLSKLNTTCVISPIPLLPKKSEWLWPKRVLEKAFKIPYTYEHFGTRVFAPKFFRLPKKPFFKTEGPIYLRKLKKVLQRSGFKPDIIHSYFLFPDGWAGNMLAKELGVPHVISIMGSDMYFVEHKLVSNMSSNALKNCDALIIQNNREFSRVQNILGSMDKVYVIDNGTNVQRFAKKNMEEIESFMLSNPLIKAKAFKFLYIGHLVNLKRVDVLIKAFSQFEKSEPESQLFIIGEGHLESKLKSLSQSLGLSHRVFFLNDIPQECLPFWYNACDCFVLPSTSEGMPNVVMEALSCGCPVIGSNVPGTADLINSIAGLTFEVDNVSDLARKIKLLKRIKWDRTSISKKAAQLLDKDIRIKKINDIYKGFKAP